MLVKERFKSNEASFDEYGRTGFQRDIDRIIFSSSFRRLQGKTQVHPLPKNDHVHNRLTHTLEVSCVGRTLGTTLGKELLKNGYLPKGIAPDELGSITQAACLAHDIGNPPFGHACETIIGDWFSKNSKIASILSDNERKDLSFFDGNAQGFRIITRNEYHFNEGGMRLSYPVLASYLKYPWTPLNSPKKEKSSCFYSEVDYLELVAEKVGLLKKGENIWCRHPLAYLVEVADDICYRIIDIEDGMELGIISENEYLDILKISSSNKMEISAPGLARREFFSNRGRVFQRIIDSAIEVFMENYSTILSGGLQGSLLDRVHVDDVEIIKNASDAAKKKLFTDRKKTLIEIGVAKNISGTLEIFTDAVLDYYVAQKERRSPSQISNKIIGHVSSEGFQMPKSAYAGLRGVVDYVAGMTDSYATFVARQFHGFGM